MGIIYYSGWYTPELCELHPDKTFVFGDNLRRFGMGGQAVIRNCANALGIATKRKPSMAESAFFTEDDLDAVLDDLDHLWQMMKTYPHREFVIPVTKDGEVSLGRERAELPKRAPNVYNTIVMHIREMANVYGSVEREEL